jgi:MazG family protein
MKKLVKADKEFEKLLKIMKRLRGPKGCKWDKAQTHTSIIENLKEESGEVISAINNNDDENLQEELGDLLLQVVFHAQMAAERGAFSIAEVIDGLNQKLIRRHPHVFGAAKAQSPQEALAQWKQIKAAEKALKQKLQEQKKKR